MKTQKNQDLEEISEKIALFFREHCRREAGNQIVKAILNRWHQMKNPDLSALTNKIAPFVTDTKRVRNVLRRAFREHRETMEMLIKEAVKDQLRSEDLVKGFPGNHQEKKSVREENIEYRRIPKSRRFSENHEWAQKLNQIKQAFDLTHREVADLVGVSERTIFNWLNESVSFRRLARDKVDKLYQVYARIAKDIKPPALRRWLFAQNEILEDSAYNLLAKGEFEKVKADIEALREGVHV
jgi:transcriptional regulator with XRE-family HTH domain